MLNSISIGAQVCSIQIGTQSILKKCIKMFSEAKTRDISNTWRRMEGKKYMKHMQHSAAVLLMNRAKDRWLERGFAKESNSNIPM